MHCHHGQLARGDWYELPLACDDIGHAQHSARQRITVATPLAATNMLLSREVGNTPARLKATGRTPYPCRAARDQDRLTRILNAWDCKPDIVSMYHKRTLIVSWLRSRPPMYLHGVTPPNVADFKAMIAQGRALSRRSKSFCGWMFKPFLYNVTAYTICTSESWALASGDPDRIWANRRVLPELMEQIATLGYEVNDTLHATGGRGVGVAKRPKRGDGDGR